MFHKPIKKELAALVESKKPKQRLRPRPTPSANGTVEGEPSNRNSPSGSGTSNSPSLSRHPNSGITEIGLNDELTPSGKHSDFQIVSTANKGWKYDIMKFAESKDKEVELTKWRQPIKLNRKDYRPPERSNGGDSGVSSASGSGAGAGDEGEDVKKTPMLGPDGKPVIGFDGRVVMVGPDGKVVGSSRSASNGGSSKPGSKAATPNGKSKPKNASRKKIKQVFLVPEETRKLRREERYPWVIEEAPLEVKSGMSTGDSNASTSSAPTTIPGQVWIGHLENPEKNQTHALLIPTGPTFQFVSSHRFYKFTKRRMDVPGAEEAEAEYAKLQKSKDPAQLWKRRKGALSEATLSTLRSESLQSSSLKTEDVDDSGYDSSRRLRAVDAGEDDIFGGGDDDEEEKILRKRRNRDLGQEGDMDEMEYEEEFADDDEKIEMDGEDEEMKEMEERLKKEYRSANKARDATIDEDEEDEEMEEINQLTGAGRDLKKLVKRTEKNEAYESDEDEENPYASEEEEEEPPPPSVLDGPAVMNQQQQPSPAGSGTPVPPTVSTPSTPQPRLPPTAALPSPPKALPHVSTTHVSKPSSPSSRPGSPLAGGLLPGMGNAIVAKRATSPKSGKARSLGAGGSAAGARSPSPSPLGGGGSKPGGLTPTGGRSPVHSRAVSPVPIVTGGAGMTFMTLKRKAQDEGPVSPVSPSSATPGASTDPSAVNKPRKKPKRPLDESMIISFLREKKEVTTKDCIQRFQPYLREEETKKAFTAMVKKVAVAKNNILVLKEEYA